MRYLGAVALLGALWPAAVSAQLMTKLSPETAQGFERYVSGIEPKLMEAASADRPLPWLGQEAMQKVRSGELVVRSYTDKDGHEVPNGLVNDWVGGLFFPGVTLERAVAALQAFDKHKQWYPEIVESKLLASSGKDARGWWLMKKKKVITVVLRAELDSQFRGVNGKHGLVVSRSKPIIEVAEYGKPAQKDYAAGEGHGFLWRFNGYWNLYEADGGVYAECRIVSLSRDVPTGLGWIVNPFIRSMPRESLESTLRNTLAALKKGG